MGAPKVDPNTLFFVRRLAVKGDTELGLTVQNLLGGIDWDALLSALPLPRPPGAVPVARERARWRVQPGTLGSGADVGRFRERMLHDVELVAQMLFEQRPQSLAFAALQRLQDVVVFAHGVGPALA